MSDTVAVPKPAKKNYRPQGGHVVNPGHEIAADIPTAAVIPDLAVDTSQAAVDALFAETPFVDDIPARQGFTQKWIRVTIGGVDDVRNIGKMHQLGWRPRSANSVPGGYSPPTIRNKQLGDVIGVGDLVLHEMPIELSNRIKAAMKRRLDSQLEAVNQGMQQQTAGRVETLKRESTATTQPT